VSTKVVIAVLVAVVVLFVLAVVIGAGQPAGDASAEQGGLIGALLDSAKRPGNVPESQLSGPCLQPGGVLAVHNECKLTVAASNDRLRTVRLTAANRVTVSAPAPDPNGHSERELRKTLGPAEGPAEELTVAVGPDGAVITLSCASCQLRLNK
jgi:hypothetical protein